MSKSVLRVWSYSSRLAEEMRSYSSRLAEEMRSYSSRLAEETRSWASCEERNLCAVVATSVIGRTVIRSTPAGGYVSAVPACSSLLLSIPQEVRVASFGSEFDPEIQTEESHGRYNEQPEFA